MLKISKDIFSQTSGLKYLSPVRFHHKTGQVHVINIDFRDLIL